MTTFEKLMAGQRVTIAGRDLTYDRSASATQFWSAGSIIEQTSMSEGDLGRWCAAREPAPVAVAAKKPREDTPTVKATAEDAEDEPGVLRKAADAVKKAVKGKGK